MQQHALIWLYTGYKSLDTKLQAGKTSHWKTINTFNHHQSLWIIDAIVKITSDNQLVDSPVVGTQRADV